MSTCNQLSSENWTVSSTSIEKTEKPSGGLAVVGAIFGKSDFVKNAIIWI